MSWAKGLILMLAFASAVGLESVMTGAATRTAWASLSVARKGGNLRETPLLAAHLHGGLRLRGGGDNMPDLPEITDDATDQDKKNYADAKQWVKRQMAELEERKKHRALEILAEDEGIDLNTSETRRANVSIAGVT